MIIGIPKEIKNQEYRVGLTPSQVKNLVGSGHQVLVEKTAGNGVGFDDDSYQIAQLSYKSCGFPYTSYLGLGFIGAVLVMMCFSPETRVGIYVGIPILLLLISVFYLFRLNRIQHSQQEQA